MKRTILICEDKPVLQLGLKELLRSVKDCKVVNVAFDGKQAVSKAKELRPSLVILKNDIPVLGGIRACREIKELKESIPVVLLLTRESDIWSALESGADGYIVREAPEYLLSGAIDTVCNGGSWIGPIIVNYLLKGEGLSLMRSAALTKRGLPSLDLLSEREKEVLRLIVDGLSNQEIAELLSLTTQTIKVHVRNIFRKVGFDSRTHAISAVLKTGVPL